MSDVRLMELAARQHRCVAWRQLEELGYGRRAVRWRVEAGRLEQVFDGVYAVAPLGERLSVLLCVRPGRLWSCQSGNRSPKWILRARRAAVQARAERHLVSARSIAR